MLIYIFEIFFVVWKYNMIFFIFERLDRMYENKTFLFLFFNVLTKIGYFNTGFVYLHNKNTNRYWSKCSNKFAEITDFFKIIFEEIFFEWAKPGPKKNWVEISPIKCKLTHIRLDSTQPNGLGWVNPDWLLCQCTVTRPKYNYPLLCSCTVTG
jgi:hypothetical protein